MTQVIHGLPRAELIKRVFGETKPAQRDSRSEKGGNNKTKGEF
jgi:hypothetical protein